ncbi:MAG TPA: hypothetical protein VJ785_00415 [Anaerolineales bacterium]|nr:hypothetical protein [Anaerolineales bacterium]
MNLNRISVRLLLAALIAAIATSAYTARAKDDSSSKIVGTWICDVPNGEPVPFQALQTFHADGTFTETSSLLGRGEEGPAHGVWKKDGRLYGLTFQLFAFDPATGENTGMFRVRVSLSLDKTDLLTATFASADFIAPDGRIMELGGGPDAYTCTRMQALPAQ